jgi:hypothetical protein
MYTELESSSVPFEFVNFFFAPPKRENWRDGESMIIPRRDFDGVGTHTHTL